MTEWRKSRRSNTSGSACVEVANLAGSIGVRDSKDPGSKLVLNAADWHALVRRVKSGGHDLA